MFEVLFILKSIIILFLKKCLKQLKEGSIFKLSFTLIFKNDVKLLIVFNWNEFQSY